MPLEDTVAPEPNAPQEMPSDSEADAPQETQIGPDTSIRQESSTVQEANTSQEDAVEPEMPDRAAAAADPSSAPATDMMPKEGTATGGSK
jgi:hypothetical protein